MPRLSKINHNNKRMEVVARHLNTRRDIRKKLKDPKVSYEEKMELRQKLDKLPRMSIEVRVRNRCGLTGHPRAYLRKFNLSRYAFRKLALQGLIPGVTKSSW